MPKRDILTSIAVVKPQEQIYATVLNASAASGDIVLPYAATIEQIIEAIKEHMAPDDFDSRTGEWTAYDFDDFKVDYIWSATAMETMDGRTVTPVEQDNEYAGEDLGRLWVHDSPHRWMVFGFDTIRERDSAMARATQQTAAAFIQDEEAK